MSLHSAASRGDDDQILHLLQQGHSVNQSNDTDTTPLFYAVTAGYLSTVKLLIEHGADVNHKNIQGHTPLMWAVSAKYDKIVAHLIEKGAHVNPSAGLPLSFSNPHISNLIRSESDDGSISSRSSGRKGSADSSISPSSSINSLQFTAFDDDDPVHEKPRELRRGSSTSDISKKSLSMADIGRTLSHSFGSHESKPYMAPQDPPTIRFLQNLSEVADDLDLEFTDISAIEVSFIPLTSQTKETKSTYQSLMKRKILGDFLIKRGGMRTNWKCRYFLLTGDHLHYFEPTMPPKGGEDQSLQEPRPDALPLGSISLHSITERIHKSDLGVVFCFQIPTTTRTYHFKAITARSIEKWLNVLNSNITRIQNASSRFSNMVFRVNILWKGGAERAVLRTGREFLTMDAIIQDYFSHIPNRPHFPGEELEEFSTGSKELLGALVEYVKSLLRLKDPALVEQVSKFVSDQSAEFFAIESRRELSGIDSGLHDIAVEAPLTCLGLSSVSREKARSSQYLVACNYDPVKHQSGIHLYDFDGYPLQDSAQHRFESTPGEILAIHFGSNNQFFSTTCFQETRPATKDDVMPNGNAKFVGNLITHIWDTQMLELIHTFSGGELLFDRPPAFTAQEHVDIYYSRKKGAVIHYLAKAISPKSIVIFNLTEKSVLNTITIELKGNEKINSVKFNKLEQNILAVASDQGIQIWDYLKNEPLVFIKYPSVSISFSNDGKKIAGLGAFKSKAKLWEVRTGKRIKKLVAGFSTAKDDPLMQHHPSVLFHPKNNQLLVLSSFGDLMCWSYELEPGDETQTIMNVEHLASLDEGQPPSTSAHDLKKEAISEAEVVLKKAKALDPAVFAECKGCILVYSTRVDFAKFSLDGLIVVTFSFQSQIINIHLTRNGELVCSFPLETPLQRFGIFNFDISHDGRQITYIDGLKIKTRTLPLDRNGDIIDTRSAGEAKEEEEEKLVSIGWVPRHIENDPMIPYYEHQLMMGIAEENQDKVKKLIKTHALNVNFQSTLGGWTPLTLACKLGFNKIVRTLIKAGADISFPRRDDNMRPIHAAASSGDAKTVLSLIENGANVNVPWDPNYPDLPIERKSPSKALPTRIFPIHIAAANGSADILEALLSANAQVETKDSNGRTPIIYAASKKENLAAVQLLVKRGADCTARGRTGTSAIHEAARSDNQKMVMLLLKEGAEAENERNSRGETAVDLNPQLFIQKKYERYLRSDTKTYLKYQVKMKGGK